MTIDQFIEKWGTRTGSLIIRYLVEHSDLKVGSAPYREAEKLADDLEALLEGDWGW